MEVTIMNRYKKIIALSILIAAPINAGMLDFMSSAFFTLLQKPKTSIALLALSGFSAYNFYKIYAYKADANRKTKELETTSVTALSKSYADKKENQKTLNAKKEELALEKAAYTKQCEEKANKQQELANSNIPSTHAQDMLTLEAKQKEIAILDAKALMLRAETAKLEKQLAELQVPTQEQKIYTEIAESVKNISNPNTSYATIKKEIDELLALENSLDKITKEYLNTKTNNQEKTVGQRLLNSIVYHLECIESLITRCTKTHDDLGKQYAGNFAYTQHSHEDAYELMGFDWELADRLTYTTVKNRIETLQHKETKRTLNKLFTDQIAKENYDAYLRGQDAWQRLGDTTRTNLEATSKYEAETLTNHKANLTNLVWKLQSKMGSR